MMINEIEYTEEKVKEELRKLDNRRRLCREYAKRRYDKMKFNLNSEDSELKKEAESFFEKNKKNSLKNYKIKTPSKSEYYLKNKDLKNATSKYQYYKRNDKMKKFLEDEKFKPCIELLKNNDNKKGSARSKYPELFENVENEEKDK